MMARTISPQDVSWFLDLNEKGQLDLDPPYQRRSVWTPKDKRFFIDTILNNYPAPPIFLHKTLDDNGRATYHVVDGKQRLNTIIDFANNKIRIPDDFADKSFDLPPGRPSFITRVLGFDSCRFRLGQARRARSPQIAQAPGALLPGSCCRAMSVA